MSDEGNLYVCSRSSPNTGIVKLFAPLPTTAGAATFSAPIAVQGNSYLDSLMFQDGSTLWATAFSAGALFKCVSARGRGSGGGRSGGG